MIFNTALAPDTHPLHLPQCAIEQSVGRSWDQPSTGDQVAVDPTIRKLDEQADYYRTLLTQKWVDSEPHLEREVVTFMHVLLRTPGLSDSLTRKASVIEGQLLEYHNRKLGSEANTETPLIHRPYWNVAFRDGIDPTVEALWRLDALVGLAGASTPRHLRDPESLAPRVLSSGCVHLQPLFGQVTSKMVAQIVRAIHQAGCAVIDQPPTPFSQVAPSESLPAGELAFARRVTESMIRLATSNSLAHIERHEFGDYSIRIDQLRGLDLQHKIGPFPATVLSRELRPIFNILGLAEFTEESLTTHLQSCRSLTIPDPPFTL